MTIPIPTNIIETVNKVEHTSHQLLLVIGREPTPQELAEKVAMPVEKARKVLRSPRPRSTHEITVAPEMVYRSPSSCKIHSTAASWPTIRLTVFSR
jgi:hypothetical protein